MDNTKQLIVEMAQISEEVIRASTVCKNDLPKVLHSKHLRWMCNQIVIHAEKWPETKLHRWIGFIQCALLANGTLGFDETKVMFDGVKQAFDERAADQDLIDHLNPDSSFELEIGGEA